MSGWAGQGVWNALLQTLVYLGLIDNWQHMVSSIHRLRAQKGGSFRGFKSITRRLYEQNLFPM